MPWWNPDSTKALRIKRAAWSSYRCKCIIPSQMSAFTSFNLRGDLWCSGGTLGSQPRDPGFDPWAEWKSHGRFFLTPRAPANLAVLGTRCKSGFVTRFLGLGTYAKVPAPTAPQLPASLWGPSDFSKRLHTHCQLA